MGSLEQGGVRAGVEHSGHFAIIGFMALLSVLMFSERDHSWKLVIEPWLVEIDVPARAVARIERTVAPSVERDGTEVLVSGRDITVWIFDTAFAVSLGDERQEFDFSEMAEAVSKFPRGRV
jgi:hypothetical protein